MWRVLSINACYGANFRCRIWMFTNGIMMSLFTNEAKDIDFTIFGAVQFLWQTKHLPCLDSICFRRFRYVTMLHLAAWWWFLKKVHVTLVSVLKKAAVVYRLFLFCLPSGVFLEWEFICAHCSLTSSSLLIISRMLLSSHSPFLISLVTTNRIFSGNFPVINGLRKGPYCFKSYPQCLQTSYVSIYLINKVSKALKILSENIMCRFFKASIYAFTIICFCANLL